MADDSNPGAAGRKHCLLTAEQVAERLGVTARTVLRLVERGGLPAPIRFNRKLVRWHERDIDDWLEGQRRGC